MYLFATWIIESQDEKSFQVSMYLKMFSYIFLDLRIDWKVKIVI